MLAIPDAYVAVGGLAVALAIVVLMVMAFRTRGGGGGRDYTASPPRETQQDYRKPHD